MNTFQQNNNSGDNIMNFGSQPRKLDDSLKEQLKSTIDDDAFVVVTSVLGDGEAYNFANEIKSYLESQGYDVKGVNQSVYSAPVNGQILEKPKDGDNTYKLIIGSKQ